MPAKTPSIWTTLHTPKYFRKSQELQVRDYSPAKRKAALRRTRILTFPDTPPPPIPAIPDGPAGREASSPREKEARVGSHPRDPKACPSRHQAKPRASCGSSKAPLNQGCPPFSPWHQGLPALNRYPWKEIPGGLPGTQTRLISCLPPPVTLAPPTAPGSFHSRFCDVRPLTERKKPARPGDSLLGRSWRRRILAPLLRQPRQHPWTQYPGGARESGNRLTPRPLQAARALVKTSGA